MSRRSIGVWFSAAVLIFLLTVLLGYEAGVGTAHVRHQRLGTMGSSDSVEKQQADAELSALNTLYTFRFGGSYDREKLKGNLNNEIDQLSALKAQPGSQAVKSVIDLHIAIASVGMSVVEQQANDTTKAHESMESAKELLRSLGWQDYSEETLKAMAQREIDKWNLNAPGEVTQK